MKKIFLKEVLINFFITFLLGFLSFWVNSIFSKNLGAQNLGLMRLFTQLIAYLNLAEMGLGTATAYSLYKPISENNIEKINIIMNTIEKFYKRVFHFIILFGGIILFTLPFFNENISLKSKIPIYWSLYVLSTANSYLYAKYSILFTANQEYKFVRVVQGLSKIIISLAQGLILLKYKSFLGFTAILAFENLLQYIIFKKHYKKKYNFISKSKKIDNSIKKNIFNLIWHKIGGVVVFNTDYIVISKFISLEAVGIYSTYILVVNILVTVVNTILNVINPKVGKFIAENNKHKIYNLWNKMNIFCVFIGTVFTLITKESINPFISLWMGKDYLLPEKVVTLLLVNLFIQLTRGITDIFKNNSGFYDDIHLPIIESIINLVSSVILVNYIGISGVILGTIASNIIVIYLWSPILTFSRCFDKNKIDYLGKIVKYIILFIISKEINNLIIGRFEFKNLDNWTLFIINLIFKGTIIVCTTFIIFLSDKIFRESLNCYFVEDRQKIL